MSYSLQNTCIYYTTLTLDSIQCISYRRIRCIHMSHNTVDSYTSTKSKKQPFHVTTGTNLRQGCLACAQRTTGPLHSSLEFLWPYTRLYTETEEALFSKNTFGGGGAGVLIYRKHKIAERPRGVNTKYLIRRSGTIAEPRRWTNAASRSERKASRPSEEPSQHQKYLYISPRRPR